MEPSFRRVSKGVSKVSLFTDSDLEQRDGDGLPTGLTEVVPPRVVLSQSQPSIGNVHGETVSSNLFNTCPEHLDAIL